MNTLNRNEYHRVAGIYAICSTLDERLYVGSAVSLYDRCQNHYGLLKRDAHFNSKLQRFVNKHGINNLQFRVLEIVPDVKDLIPREQYYIDYFNSYKVGFNNSPTAGNTLGVVFTEETKRKIGAKSIGRKRTQESLDKQAREAIGRHAGEKHPNVKLTESTAIEIKKMSYLGYSTTIISTFLNLNPSTVLNIVTNNRWKYLGEIVPTEEDKSRICSVLGINKKKVRGLSVEDVMFIRENKDTMSAKELAEKFNVSKTAIRNTILYVIHKDIP